MNYKNPQSLDAAFSAAPLRLPRPTCPPRPPTAIDVAAFLLLIAFQIGVGLAIMLFSAQIGETGLIVFGILFIWLGALLSVGLRDLLVRSAQTTEERWKPERPEQR